MHSSQVRPTELPRLNGSSVTHVGHTGTANVYAVTEVHLQAPDGRMVEVQGEAGIGIDAHGGSMIFRHPVESRLEGDSIVIRSANHPETRLRLNEIDAAYARTRSRWNGVLGGLGGAVGGALLGLIIISAI